MSGHGSIGGMDRLSVVVTGNGGDTAAWVQAVGSLIALAIAIAIPLVSSWLERRRFRASALALARQAVRAIRMTAIYSGAVVPAERDAVEDLNADSWELTITAVAGYMVVFPLDRLGSQVAIDSFIRILGASQNVVAMAKARQGGNLDAGDIGRLLALAESRFEKLKEALR